MSTSPGIIRRGDDTAEKFFRLVTRFPKLVITIGVVGIVAMAISLPKLVKDTTADSFIAKDNPSVVYRDKVKKIFGLDDPFVVAIISKNAGGIYNTESLNLVATLTERVKQLENIDPDRVTSLATESNIVGTNDGMDVTDFYELDPDPNANPNPTRIRAAIDDFPLYQGSLVARDGSGTLIVAEMIDTTISQETYDRLLALVATIDAPAGIEVHVAGEGAVSGYLATYIDNDATRLNPLSALVITLVLIVAFRTTGGAVLPNIVVMATAAGSLGLMALSGVSLFVITNGLLPILIGIAVADSIHILSEYYENLRRRPELTQREAIVVAMTAMWRPVTLTTLTAIAGFAGLWIGAEMPPMKYFGLFAAIGVFIAWVYSLLLLPAVVTALPFKRSPIFRHEYGDDRFSRLMSRFGRGVLAYPRSIIAVVIVIGVVGTIGASRLVVEEAQIENFQHDEPLYVADSAINAIFDGTNYLDIVIETSASEGLFQPATLLQIEALQEYAETLNGVQGSTSVVDYIKQMHKAVNENSSSAYSIPDDELLIAQLFLLHSTSGDPTDFEKEVDYNYQKANVRLLMNTSLYRNNSDVIEALQRYIDEQFNYGDITANLSGRVYVNHHWLKTIEDSHFRSVGISLLLVWLMAAAVFRSFPAGAFALIPVVMSILLIYAVMGFGGIWLGVGTSMFAAIAIGLGIDFSIHTIDRMRELLVDPDADFDRTIAPLFRTTGRALFFNFAAIGLGFLVLATSEVPPLIKFGVLVAIAVAAAFFASVALLPALTKIFRPRFIVGTRRLSRDPRGQAVSVGATIAAFSIVILMSVSPKSHALPDLDGTQIMQQVVDRDEGEWVSRALQMRITDRNGIERVRETLAYRRYYGEEKRTVIFYTSPTNVKDTGFLTYDYPDADRDDDQWLYLPALRKVRRISASDRGDYFLGTDFSYEDIKKENKIAMEDYTLEKIGEGDVDGHTTYIVEGIPVDSATAEELGYGKVQWFVDPNIWISRKSEAWDTRGNALKTTHSSDIELIDGIWTVQEIEVENHKTGHGTIFTFSNVDYEKEVADKVLGRKRPSFRAAPAALS